MKKIHYFTYPFLFVGIIVLLFAYYHKDQNSPEKNSIKEREKGSIFYENFVEFRGDFKSGHSEKPFETREFFEDAGYKWAFNSIGEVVFKRFYFDLDNSDSQGKDQYELCLARSFWEKGNSSPYGDMFFFRTEIAENESPEKAIERLKKTFKLFSGLEIDENRAKWITDTHVSLEILAL